MQVLLGIPADVRERVQVCGGFTPWRPVLMRIGTGRCHPCRRTRGNEGSGPAIAGRRDMAINSYQTGLRRLFVNKRLRRLAAGQVALEDQ